MADFQAHDRHHALGVGLLVAFLDADVGLELLGEVGQHRRWAGVQTGGVGNDDRFGSDRLDCFDGFLDRATGQGQIQNRVLPGGHLARTRRKGRHPFAIGDHDLSQQAFGVGGDVVGVEVDQGIAGLHRIARLDARSEAGPLEPNGIETDMHQHFDALRGGDGDGVSGRMQLGDLAVAGRAQTLIERIDGDAVADHFLGEHRVGNSFDRHQGAG